MSDKTEDIVPDLLECAAESRASEGDYYADQFATSPEIFERAANEIKRLRGEVILWKAAAHLTKAEEVTLAVAIDHVEGLHCGNTKQLARELRWLRERLT